MTFIQTKKSSSLCSSVGSSIYIETSSDSFDSSFESLFNYIKETQDQTKMRKQETS